MNTIKSLSYGSIALAMLIPSTSFAETGQAAVAISAATDSRVHRVSHSLAEVSAYTGSASGYKWGNKAPEINSANTQWAKSSTRGSYKWGNPASDSRVELRSYANAPSYQWGTMGFSGQSGYRWGMNSFSDQSGYRWGMNSFSDQSGYRWGMNSFSDQSGYRWGMN
jgi:hypothetical protein